MPETPCRQSIQTYNLFGESRDLPDVVHCETIEARSSLHDWEFAPHRHGRLHQILLIESGEGLARLDDCSHVLGPMTMINVPVGAVHGFSFTPGTQGWIVTLATEIMDEALAPSEGLRQVLAQAQIGRGASTMRTTMEQIFVEFAGRHFARAHVLRALSFLLIGLVAREMTEGGARPGGGTKTELLQRFETLLETHFLAHWTVSDYARELSVTPTHLSRLTRALNGRGASQIILDRVIREARRNLVYTNLSISTICYSLGFHDPAYFSRVFAGATGMSPSAFRARANAK